GCPVAAYHREPGWFGFRRRRSAGERKNQSTISTPIERAVPSMDRMQASMDAALVSLSLISAISRTCALVSLPILSLLGRGEPEPPLPDVLRPSAFLMRTPAGGVLVMNVKERSE